LTLNWEHKQISPNQAYWVMFLAAVFRSQDMIAQLVTADMLMVRWGAIRALSEKWPDDATRKLLEERALQDKESGARSAAIQALSANWPDDSTRKLLEDRARVDGTAASLLAGQYSKFGRLVFTRDVDGLGPYLDPTEPISREHIERAAEKAGVPPDQIDETVRSLSGHMGWDITKGSGGANDECRKSNDKRMTKSK
jgi:hypothetical protein